MKGGRRLSRLLPFLLSLLLLGLWFFPEWVPSYSKNLEDDEEGSPHTQEGPDSPIRGVIYLMAGLEEQLDSCRLLLEQLKDNLKVKYPVVIFYDDPALAPRLQRFQKVFAHDFRLTVIPLKFEIPEWVSREQVVPLPSGFVGKYSTVGYRHMCRFYSGLVFNHPALLPYDYAWRLDPGLVPSLIAS